MYYKTQKDAKEKSDIKQAIEQQIFTNSKLYESEFLNLLSFLCKNQEHYIIQMDCLDDCTHIYRYDYFWECDEEINRK